ncbi:hypothetical protein [Marisediminicola sp. LYQ134]|uniref:hypothetical protein n=1 Tax=unclassified Marisediminicola TaxID=2618316 RepID=UPI003983B3C1
MTRWQPAKADTLAAIVTEILHNYGTGRAIVAVDAADGALSANFATDLAEAFAARPHAVERATFAPANSDGTPRRPSSDDAALFGETVVAPFRRASTSPAVLVVDGSFVLDPAVRAKWNFAIWLDGPASSTDGHDGSGPAEALASYLVEARPRASAVAIVDVSDPDHPRRVFADTC